MTAVQKEQIFTELRKYHLDEFPDSLVNSDMNDLLSEYRELEDQIISMLLGLVNGKSEYQDLSKELEDFLSKAKPVLKGDKAEASDRQHFLSKIEQLEHILKIAAMASFTVKPPRKVRESTRSVVTKVTKS